MNKTDSISEENIELVREECRGFPEQFSTLQMATADANGRPNASYAAYVREGQFFYIYISELAQHTQNIQSLVNVSVLFIENEGDARHSFVRKRLTLDCSVAEILRDNPSFPLILDTFQNKFGKLVKTLRDLGDFHLFQLRPEAANFVTGFGRAFSFTGEALEIVQHKNAKGHSPLNK